MHRRNAVLSSLIAAAMVSISSMTSAQNAPAPLSTLGSVAGGAGNLYGGNVGASYEYISSDIGVFVAAGSWDAITSAAGGVRFYNAERKYFLELGGGPLAKSWTVYGDGSTSDMKMYSGFVGNVGGILQLSDRLDILASVGVGYSSELQKTALGKSTITTLGVGLRYSWITN